MLVYEIASIASSPVLYVVTRDGLALLRARRRIKLEVLREAAARRDPSALETEMLRKQLLDSQRQLEAARRRQAIEPRRAPPRRKGHKYSEWDVYRPAETYWQSNKDFYWSS